MGFMQVYRVGPTAGEAALGKISRLLTGEGIDSDDLGDQRPDTGCVLIDLNTGEENESNVSCVTFQLPCASQTHRAYAAIFREYTSPTVGCR